ncbi:hypothetical protein EDC04DRAFT_2870454 [Pisolithus marmoratus]|nr:hypothetical protein EDC04DRAFT_2870454 [Pisolithus marmoratus]
MSGSQSVDLTMCPCEPTALQLLQMGFFPCAPLGPTLTVSLQVLSLVQQLFMCMPPNVLAWCESLEAYLGGMGYKVDTKGGLHRRFGNAYHWYCILKISLDEYIQQHLHSKMWPLEYLRQCCPLCFGSYNWQNDKYDDPANPTATVFLSREDIDSMEHEVNSLRKMRSSVQKSGHASKRHHRDEDDGFEQGMRIPTSVLKGCNESFTAADERCQKASTQFLSDTGVMALLCCHDCVIHLANMTSAGEKQHYALALIKSFFSHLPDDFHIGLLYDIGCQLEQSCRKEGFGLTDGEGCERFWSAIKALIPTLCVSGHLFAIDFQVHHLDMKSLTGLGQWILWHWNHCQVKKASANKGLRKCGVDTLTLQAEWVSQVAVQTKAAPHRLITDESYEVRLDELEKELLHGVSDMTSLNIQLAECHKKIRGFKQVLQKQKEALGVNGLADLAKLQDSSHLQLHMHALAIKTRIQDHLHQHKFELERLEHSYRQTVSEQRLQNHTETSLSTNYNNICLQMAALIHQGKAPHGSIAPVLIPRDALFKLDVDDDIWQDSGLDGDLGGLPPAWLADQKVCSGIRSLLDLRHCEEEERHLLHERRTLMEWFAEEWS